MLGRGVLHVEGASSLSNECFSQCYVWSSLASSGTLAMAVTPQTDQDLSLAGDHCLQLL